jgi:hypothetical protein
MLNKKIYDPKFSFVMSPYYLIDDDNLLKSQLFNLNYQTRKIFEVIIPDPHYKKRSWINNFSNQLKYNVVHFPYESNLKTPKMFDYGIFNDGVLMSSSNKIITFQDWRFVHHSLCDILLNFESMWFVGFTYQTCNRETHDENSIKIEKMEAHKLYNTGFFPEIKYETTYTNTFHNPSWGHYCINKELWMQINGIDEVATNTRHYADLDMNCRLQECYRRKGWTPNIPMLKNVMVRMNHRKGGLFGSSHVQVDYEVNNSFNNCCFIKTNSMNDKNFVEHTLEKVRKQEWIKLYEVPYSEKFKRTNTNPNLDTNHSTIGFQCKNCGVIAETPHWYEKSPEARVSSLLGIGIGNIKLGRNLNKINKAFANKTFEEKIKILRNSWYEPEFLTE